MEILKSESYLRPGDKVFISKSPYILNSMEHGHDFLELVYIYSGNAVHCINGREYRTSFGDTVLLDYSDAHTFRDMSDDFTIITCAFVPELIDSSIIDSKNAADFLQSFQISSLSPEHTDFRFSINLASKHDEFGRILEEMYLEYIHKEKGYQIVLRGMLTVLLAKIFRAAAEKNMERKASKEGVLIAKALDYLKENYSKPIKAEDIARLVLFSPGYFATVFKNVTGTNLTEYLHRLRVAEACKLLVDTDRSVSDIMNEVGYSDRKFFYNIFKRYTGLTPGTYRNNSV